MTKIYDNGIHTLPKDKGLEKDTPISDDDEQRHQKQEQTPGEQNGEYKEDPFYYDPKLTNLKHDSTSIAHQDRDDEQEFNRIPIAGEDSEDYNTSDDGEDEFEEEEEEPVTTPDHSDHANIGAGGAFKTFCLKFLVDETVDIGIEVGCWASMGAGSDGVVKGG